MNRFDGTSTYPKDTNPTELWNQVYETIRTVSPDTMISSYRGDVCASTGSLYVVCRNDIRVVLAVLSLPLSLHPHTYTLTLFGLQSGTPTMAPRPTPPTLPSARLSTRVANTSIPQKCTASPYRRALMATATPCRRIGFGEHPAALLRLPGFWDTFAPPIFHREHQLSYF